MKRRTPEQAIVEAAMVRFRPIMMTTMAAMMGTLPIVFGTGMGRNRAGRWACAWRAGCCSRRP